MESPLRRRKNLTPMNTQQAKHTPAMTLDTFEADLLNESPSRRETVTEIQTEDGALLCYAEPIQATRLAHCWNNHDSLLEALQACEIILSAIECGHDKPLATGQVLDAARAAIQAATGGKV